MREAKKNGRTVEDIVETWRMPERCKEYAAPAPERLQANVENIYMEGKPLDPVAGGVNRTSSPRMPSCVPP